MRLEELYGNHALKRSLTAPERLPHALLFASASFSTCCLRRWCATIPKTPPAGSA